MTGLKLRAVFSALNERILLLTYTDNYSENYKRQNIRQLSNHIRYSSFMLIRNPHNDNETSTV